MSGVGAGTIKLLLELLQLPAAALRLLCAGTCRLFQLVLGQDELLLRMLLLLERRLFARMERTNLPVKVVVRLS
jgi:hypothetical protein